MYNPIKKLHPHNFFKVPIISSKNGGISRDITTFLILDTIRKVYVITINHIFNYIEGSISLPIMPKIKKITIN